MDRAEVSRRLKAARWLNGGLDPKGRPVPLPVEELAAQPALTKNRITPNRLQEIEQMKTTVRSVELVALADALGLPSWFDGVAEANPERVGQLWRQTLDAVDRGVGQDEGPSQRGSGGTDPPGEDEEGVGT